MKSIEVYIKGLGVRVLGGVRGEVGVGVAGIPDHPHQRGERGQRAFGKIKDFTFLASVSLL